MHAAREVRHEQHETPVVAVGHDPGRHRQDDVRDHAHRPEQPEHDRIAGFAVDHDESATMYSQSPIALTNSPPSSRVSGPLRRMSR